MSVEGKEFTWRSTSSSIEGSYNILAKERRIIPKQIVVIGKTANFQNSRLLKIKFLLGVIFRVSTVDTHPPDRGCT